MPLKGKTYAFTRPKIHKTIRVLIVLWVFTFYGVVCAQSTASTKTQSLISQLSKLEAKFNIKFSYVDEDLQNVNINLQNVESLDLVLSELSSSPLLSVTEISDRYYALTVHDNINICGSVRDNFAQPLPGATLEILGAEKAVVTNLDGDFQITQVPRDALVEIRYLGYRPKFVKAVELTQEPCSQILLMQNYEELEEVVVFDFLTQGLIKEDDASYTLNTEGFGLLPGLTEPDVLKSVQALPGIKSIDETVSDINVRGGTNDQNLMLWDGIKLYQSGHFFGLISAFNPYLTEDITIIKNGTPAQFGDGVSSVISMHTKDEIKDQLFGGAGLNLLSGDVYAQFPTSRNTAFQFSARRATTDLVQTPTYQKFYERAFQDSDVNQTNGQTTGPISQNEDFYFYDITAKFLYDVSDEHKIRFSFININNQLAYTETLENTGETSSSTLKQENLSFGARWKGQWSHNLFSDLNLYSSHYRLFSNNIEPNNVQQLTQENDVLEYAVKLNTKYVLNDQWTFYNGYQLTETGIANITLVSEPFFESKIKSVVRAHALFSEIEHFSQNQRWKTRVGLRANYLANAKTFNTFDELIFEPRLNSTYELFKDFRVELLGEFKSQTTNQIIDLEQNFLGVEKRRWILSNNTTLPITKSKQASFGFNYDHNRWYFGADGFYKNVDGISTLTQGFQNENQFNGEVGSYDVYGAEFLVNRKTSTYSAWLSYTYNVNNYFFPELTPSEFPNNLDITHHVTVAGLYNYENLKLGIGLNYRTGKPYTEPLEGDQAVNTSIFPNQINYKSPNSSRLNDYMRLDASATYNFKIGNLQAVAGVSVVNILNRKNLLNRYYRLNDQSQVETVESSSLGLTPNVSFRVKF